MHLISRKSVSVIDPGCCKRKRRIYRGAEKSKEESFWRLSQGLFGVDGSRAKATVKGDRCGRVDQGSVEGSIWSGVLRRIRLCDRLVCLLSLAQIGLCFFSPHVVLQEN